MTGPESLSLEQVAEPFGSVTGRPTSYVNETLEEAWASRRTYGAADWQIEAWVSTYLQIAAGELDVVRTLSCGLPDTRRSRSKNS